MKPSILAASLGVLVSSASVIENQQLLSDHRASIYDAMDDEIAKSPLLSLHRSICEIEGISDDEQAAGEFLASYLTEHNFKVEKQIVPRDNADETAPPRFNVYAYPAWQSAAPEVILTSHIDTVPPHIPYSLSTPGSSTSREDILISGRGTVDAKACIAAQTHAAETYLASNPDARVGLLFVVSEETDGAGMTFFSDSDLNTPYPSKQGGGERGGYHTVIFGEPTEHALAAGHKGALGFRVSAQGKPAHSGYPWLGRSAISRILPILKNLDELGVKPESEGGLPRNEKYGNSTVNIGVMQGGAASNVVPAFAEAEGTIRVAGGTIDHAKELVEKAVWGDGSGSIDDVKVSMEGDYYSPVDLDADVEGFGSIIANYGTDVPNLDVTRGHGDGQSQVKRYLYGPGTIHVCHGEDEGLTVGDLEKGYQGYYTLIDAAVKRGKELKR